MHKQILFCTAASLMVCLVTAPLVAQPTISGDLSGTLGPGEFIVTGDCNVPAGETLVISPGTTLLFSAHYGLYVYGQLTAEGTETDSIFFIRQFPTEECKHSGIRIQPGASTGNTLSYCRIDNAFNPQFPDCFGGGLICWEAGVTITHCAVTNCTAFFGGGIYIIDSDASITDCLISGCSAIAEGGALYAAFSSILISDCAVFSNSADHVGGIYLFTNDEAEVRYCTVYLNSASTTAG